jgi:soluble lytic murein transglycosylase-like protein
LPRVNASRPRLPWLVATLALIPLGGAVVLAADESAPRQLRLAQLADEVPEPKQPIPRDPAGLAAALTANTRALHAAIDSWRSAGDPVHERPPDEVELRALYHQRIHIVLSRDRRLARRTIARLPGRLAAEARDLVAARRALVRLAGPPPRRRPRWRTGKALPPDRLMRLYRSAQRRFGVSRRVLAAVNHVETNFNKLRSLSTAGARGPMQFIPSTWRAYGMGGDIDDPRDAILGAANYLHASGAPPHYRRALFAYNPSSLYVDAVLRYTRAIRREARTFYVLHSWQVFVRGRDGRLKRITGPRPR